MGLKRILLPHLKVALPLFIVFFVFFLCSLFRLESIFFNQEVMFYADTIEITDSMRSITFRQDMVKHLLFSLTTSPLVSLIKLVFGLSENHAILVVLALFAALNVTVCYITLNLFIKNNGLSILFSIFFGFAFSNIIYFSIPETYILTELTIIIYSYFLIKFKNHINVKRTSVLFILTAVAPFYNPPLLLLLIPTGYIYFKNFAFKRFLLTFLSNILFVASAFAVPYFFIPCFILPHTVWSSWYDVMYPIQLLEKWASFSNFLNLEAVANTVGNFLFFSVISPFEELKATANFMTDYLDYFDSIRGVFVILLYTGLLSLCVFYIVKKRNRIIDAFLLFLPFVTAFYVYFNPNESFLYSTQILFPLTLIFSGIVNDVKLKYKSILLGFFLLLMIYNNLISLFSPVILPR